MSRLVLGLAVVIGLAGQEVPTRALHPDKPLGAGKIRQLSYSPDGHLLAVVTTVGFQIRDADSGRALNTIVDNLPAAPRSAYYVEPWLSELAWSPDGKRVARAATGIEIWDPLGPAPQRILPASATDHAFHELAWSPTGKEIAARSESELVVWSLNSGRRFAIRIQSACLGCNASGGYAWSPDGTRLAIFEDLDSAVIDVWDVAQRRRIQRIATAKKLKNYYRPQAGDDAVQMNPDQSKIEWSPDGRVLALYFQVSGLSLWDPTTGSLLRQIPPGENIVSLSWSNDSKLLRVGAMHQFRLLDSATGSPVWVLNRSEKEQWIRCSAVSPDGQRSVASFDDGRLLLWRERNPQPKLRIQTSAIGDRGLKLSPDLTKMAAMSGEEVGVWDAASGAKLAGLVSGSGEYAWSPDSRTLAILRGEDLPQALHLLRPSSGQPARNIQLPSEQYFEYNSLSWSLDGARILARGNTHALIVRLEDGTLQPAPAGTGGMLLWTADGNLARHSIPGMAALQSPDFKAAVLWQSNQLSVWDIQENRLLWAIPTAPERQLSQVAWSPDSQRLAFVSKTGSVDIWDRTTATVVERWTTPGSWPWNVPSYLIWREKLIALSSLGGAIQLWREP